MAVGCKNDSIVNTDVIKSYRDSTNSISYRDGQITNLLLNGNPWEHPVCWKTEVIGDVQKPVTFCNIFYGSLQIRSYECYVDNNKTYFLPREIILIDGINLSPGSYLITKERDCGNLSSDLVLLGEDGDAGVGYYNRINSKFIQNTVTIDSYNKATGDVIGTFDITFVKKFKTLGYFNNYTDTVHFNNGTFKTKWLLK